MKKKAVERDFLLRFFFSVRFFSIFSKCQIKLSILTPIPLLSSFPRRQGLFAGLAFEAVDPAKGPEERKRVGRSSFFSSSSFALLLCSSPADNSVGPDENGALFIPFSFSWFSFSSSSFSSSFSASFFLLLLDDDEESDFFSLARSKVPAVRLKLPRRSPGRGVAAADDGQPQRQPQRRRVSLSRRRRRRSIY